MTDKLCKKAWELVRNIPNVCGYSEVLQPRIKEGKIVQEELCFRVYVTRKIHSSAIYPKDCIPHILDLGGESIPTDVVEIGEMKALEEEKKRGLREKVRPLEIGISCTSIYSTACTLGGFVRDKKTGELCILSNWHCFGREGKAKEGEAIVQPSPFDGGTIDDKVAEYVRGTQIRFSNYLCPYRNTVFKISKILGLAKEATNTVDASIARIICTEWKNEIYGIGPLGKEVEIAVGDKVSKVGRTTGYTTDGLVMDTNWAGYVRFNRGIAFFKDQILISKANFSAPGDSGSRVSQDMNSVGLLFAGSEYFTIANKMKNVYEKLEVLPP